MAIFEGMTCMGCDKKPARHGSHYCTDKCGVTFCKLMRGPIQCDECGAEEDDIGVAKKAGWKKIVMTPEGITTNYGGICPECV